MKNMMMNYTLNVAVYLCHSLYSPNHYLSSNIHIPNDGNTLG